MSIHIIVDGYNLIRQSPSLSSLERIDIQQGREVLVDRLATYKRIKSHKITVVFDGAKAPSFSAKRVFQKGITIKFSRNRETADTVIKRMAKAEKEKALVVSSDREVVAAAESYGAATINSPDFEKKLILAGHMNTQDVDTEEEEQRGWKPTTKKKGPRRRLSKSMRRNKLKINKL